jgi:hypothetical protein
MVGPYAVRPSPGQRMECCTLAGSSSSPSSAWLEEASAGPEYAFFPQTPGEEKGYRPTRGQPPTRCAPLPQPG